MTKDKFIKQYKKCLDLDGRLMDALGTLGRMASEALGREVQADTCNGGEIEFRRITCGEGFVDDFDTKRLEDVLANLE